MSKRSIPETRLACANTGAGRSEGFLLDLAPDGVFRASALALGAVGSYPTFSPLPRPLPAVAVCSLWHFPSGRLAASPPACIRRPHDRRLRGIAPCGVRTFLPRLAPGAIPHPSKIKDLPQVRASPADSKEPKSPRKKRIFTEFQAQPPCGPTHRIGLRRRTVRERTRRMARAFFPPPRKHGSEPWLPP